MIYSVVVEKSLRDFEFWGDALPVVEKIITYDEANGTQFWNFIIDRAEKTFNDERSHAEEDVNSWMSLSVPLMKELKEVFA